MSRCSQGEEVVIITEESKMRNRRGRGGDRIPVGAHPILTIMEPREQDSQEPPRTIAVAMKPATLSFPLSENPLPIRNAVKEATQNGSRGVVLTQFSEDMMIHGGIECNFEGGKSGMQGDGRRSGRFR